MGPLGQRQNMAFRQFAMRGGPSSLFKVLEKSFERRTVRLRPDLISNPLGHGIV